MLEYVYHISCNVTNRRAITCHHVNYTTNRTSRSLILEAIGEDPNREGLLDTPKRVAKMYEEVFSGLNEDPKEHFKTVFGEDHEELVLVKDIPFYSMCEHHLVPFYGKAHVAYIPKGGRVTGLSKLARAVEAVAKRPQLTGKNYIYSGGFYCRNIRAARGNGSSGSRAYVYDHARH